MTRLGVLRWASRAFGDDVSVEIRRAMSRPELHSIVLDAVAVGSGRSWGESVRHLERRIAKAQTSYGSIWHRADFIPQFMSTEELALMSLANGTTFRTGNRPRLKILIRHNTRDYLRADLVRV